MSSPLSALCPVALTLLVACGGAPNPKPAPIEAPAAAPDSPRVTAALPHLIVLAEAMDGLADAVMPVSGCSEFAAAVKGWAAPYATPRPVERRLYDGEAFEVSAEPMSALEAAAWQVFDQALSPADAQSPKVAALEARYAEAVKRYGAAPVLERCGADPAVPEQMGRGTMRVLSGLPEALDELYQPPEQIAAVQAMSTITTGAEALADAVTATQTCAALRGAIDQWVTAEGQGIGAAVRAADDAPVKWQDGDMPAVVVEQILALEARYLAAIGRVSGHIEQSGGCDSAPEWGPVGDRLHATDLPASLRAFD